MRRAPVTDLQHRLDQAAHTQSPVTLPQETTHYLIDVLRLTVGEQVELFDGLGLSAIIEIISTSPKLEVEIRTTHRQEKANQTPRVILCQSIPKGDRWEWLIEKCTELGVDEIYPVVSARTVVKIADKKLDKKITRWESIMQGAARQSGRTLFTKIHHPTTLKSLVHTTDGEHTHIVASLHHTTQPIDQIINARTQTGDIFLWVGPEGGWTPDELQLLEHDLGAAFTTLGEHVLRAETAAVSVVTLAKFFTQSSP